MSNIAVLSAPSNIAVHYQI